MTLISDPETLFPDIGEQGEKHEGAKQFTLHVLNAHFQRTVEVLRASFGVKGVIVL